MAWLDLANADTATISRSTTRSALPDPNIRRQAAAIVDDVRDRGDAAVIDYSKQFGGALSHSIIEVPPKAVENARAGLGKDVASAMETAIWNVRACHQPQLPTSTTTTQGSGVTVERVWSPLGRVGVYVPGGRAVYPSSLIMGVVPAMVAGVAEICVVTPARPDGAIDPIVLGAASMLGINEMYAIGGAQAVGALAYGTETVGRVDKIVGPGGPWVTAGKLAVYGECGVDLPAGPSEAAVVVDGTVDPVAAAADVLCQAEHGEESSVVLIATSREVAVAVLDETDRQLATLERSDIIAKALENHGTVVIAASTPEALSYANAWAPEHLSLHTADARSDAAAIPNAGSVFIGTWTPEAAGDYATGANHVLPTGGLARAYGPLSVDDFGSWRQIQTMTREGLELLAPTITALANAEGLTAHANSVRVRLEMGS